MILSDPLHYDPGFCILHLVYELWAIIIQIMKVKCPRFNLHVPLSESAFAKDTSSRWTNADLDPVPHHLRNWGVMSFVGMSPAATSPPPLFQGTRGVELHKLIQTRPE